MMLERVNVLTAFLAGLLSFFSPCTLPLVPLFLGHLAGLTGDELTRPTARVRALIFRNALAFVLGFSLIFVLFFGLPAGLLTRTPLGQRTLLLQLGGLFLIVLGLNTLGVIRVPALLRERRIHWQPARRGSWPASLLVGATFGLGWTPCIGAILGTITMMAAASRGAGQALVLLAIYSLGLGLPFLAVAAGFGQIAPTLRRLNRHLRVFNALAGALIVVVGVLMLAGTYQELFARFVRLIPWAPPL